MKQILFYALIVVMTCGMYSCKSNQKKAQSDTVEAGAPENALVDTHWRLIEIMGNPVTFPESAPKEAFIQFRADGTVSGSLGCNNFFGEYTVNPEALRISFSKLGNTSMMCINMDVETEFLQVLNTADNYNLNGDQLVLNRARMAPLARFEAVSAE